MQHLCDTYISLYTRISNLYNAYSIDNYGRTQQLSTITELSKNFIVVYVVYTQLYTSKQLSTPIRQGLGLVCVVLWLFEGCILPHT